MSIFILKIIALLTMIIDHIGYFFIENSYCIYFREVGRISAPIFLFVFTEGYLKTSNRRKYQQRLFISSIIMFIGNYLLSLFCDKMYPLNTNIIFTMFLCSLVLNVIEYKNSKLYKFFLISFLLIPIYYAEYSYIALSCVIIYYIYLKNLEKQENKNIVKLIFIVFYLFYFLIYTIIIKNPIQYFMVLSLIPILFYNFKIGFKNIYIKYFYYIFYIVHLWLFVLLKNFIFN